MSHVWFRQHAWIIASRVVSATCWHCYCSNSLSMYQNLFITKTFMLLLFETNQMLTYCFTKWKTFMDNSSRWKYFLEVNLVNNCCHNSRTTWVLEVNSVWDCTEHEFLALHVVVFTVMKIGLNSNLDLSPSTIKSNQLFENIHPQLNKLLIFFYHMFDICSIYE